MAHTKTQGASFKLGILTAAVLAVYPTVHAAGLKLEDGDFHRITFDSFDYIEVRAGVSKSQPTTLEASGLTIDDDRIDANHGAVFAKGGIIDISDSEIRTSGNRSGLQAFSAQEGEPETSITATNVSVTTAGERAHGAFVYVEHTTTPRSDTQLIFSSGTISTEGAKASGLLVGGRPVHLASGGKGTLKVDNSVVSTSGAEAHGLRSEYRGVAELTDTDIFTEGSKARGVTATSAGTVKLTGGSVNTKDGDGLFITDNGSKIESAGLTINAGGATHANAVYVYGEGAVFEASDLTAYSVAPQKAKGILVEYGGKATINNGYIETTGGVNSHAIDVWGEGSEFTSDGVDVSATAYVLSVGEGAKATIRNGNFHVRSVTLADGWDTSVGIGVGGIAKAGAELLAENIKLTNSVPLSDTPPQYTSYAMRVGAPFAYGVTMGLDSKLTLRESEVIASGKQRRVALIERSSRLDVYDSLLVSEEDAGIVLADNASLTMTGSTLESAGESLRSTFAEAGAKQEVILQNSTLKKNNGTLLRVNRSGDGSDGVINMTLQSGSQASGNIRNYLDGELVDHNPGLTNFVVNPGAIWTGIFINSNTTVIDDGAGDQNDFTTGEGEDVAIEGSGSGTQNFNGTTNIGGSVSVGRNVAFNGPTTIGSNLLGQDGTNVAIAGPANIGGSVTGGNGANFSFNSTTNIGGGVQ